MSDDHRKAAEKLATNLCENLNSGEAIDFVSYVSALVCVKFKLSPADIMQDILHKFSQIVMEGVSSGMQECGHCLCNAQCFIRQTSEGPLVIHRGAACHHFKRKFQDGPTRAQDELLWDNFSNTNTPHMEPPKPDDSRDRFALLEFT